MSAEIIDGKAIAEEVRREVAAEVADWVAAGNDPPGLATVLVGEDPASSVYVGGKQKATHEVGMRGFDDRLSVDTPQGDVEALLGELNGDPRVSGILLQLPMPKHIDGAGLTWLIDPAKDVDGLTPSRPACSPRAAPAFGRARRPAAWSCSIATASSSRAPRRSWSAAPTSSASRSRRCCWRATRRSRCATRARATCRASAAAPTCSSRRSGARA